MPKPTARAATAAETRVGLSLECTDGYTTAVLPLYFTVPAANKAVLVKPLPESRATRWTDCPGCARYQYESV